MQPFEVKLDYRDRPWCTVAFELGHNEIGDAEEPEYRLAYDLVDLQFLAAGETVDLLLTKTCSRLFEYRRQQEWPPRIAVGGHWDTLYEEAADGLDVLATVDDAIIWVNEFIERIAQN